MLFLSLRSKRISKGFFNWEVVDVAWLAFFSNACLASFLRVCLDPLLLDLSMLTSAVRDCMLPGMVVCLLWNLSRGESVAEVFGLVMAPPLWQLLQVQLQTVCCSMMLLEAEEGANRWSLFRRARVWYSCC